MTEVQTVGPSKILETPEETFRRFAQHIRERDLEKLVALYEPDALFCPEPKVNVKGHAGLRAGFQDLFVLKPVLEIVPAQVHESGDLALVENDWTLSGTAPDGTSVSKSGRSSVVLRRDSDGTWLIAIDRP